MKDRYKALAKPRNLLTGGLGASGRDLSTLFVARAIEKYLKTGGGFAFVMPHGTLTRLPHTGFRTGNWSSVETGPLTVSFGTTWDLTKTPTGFPMVSCVISGTATSPAVAMTHTVEKWSSTLKTADVTWADAATTFTTTTGDLSQLNSDADLPVSPYKKVFRNGAILYPRMLIVVEPAPAPALGAGAGRRRVRSRRTTTEKAPWKNVETIEKSVESAHVHPVHLGETILPYRPVGPLLVVLPLDTDRIMKRAELDEHPGLASWWDEAEQKWATNKVANDTSELVDRIDYHGQLAAQLPLAQHRVVYTASGNTLAAARLDDPTAVIEHKLYWAPVGTVSEARYLTGILNSKTLLTRVTPLQNVGLFGARDFDKNVFYVNFGLYDPTDPNHATLVELVTQAEAVAAGVTVDAGFQRNRASVRTALETAGLAQQIEDAVNKILPVITT